MKTHQPLDAIPQGRRRTGQTPDPSAQECEECQGRPPHAPGETGCEISSSQRGDGEAHDDQTDEEEDSGDLEEQRKARPQQETADSWGAEEV